MTEPSTVDRFWANVRIQSNGCWEWMGPKGGLGYARLQLNGEAVYVHRWSYEQTSGPIPAGLGIDHLCRNHGCVNPGHLEAVTTRENCLRGISPAAVNAVMTHCVHGHEFTDENTYRWRGHRKCRACHARNERDKRSIRDLRQFNVLRYMLQRACGDTD